MQKNLRRRMVFLSRKVKRIFYGLVGTIPTPEKWLFILGCYNSGTTLLYRLLGRHPQIASLPTEGQFITDQLTVPEEVGLARNWVADPDRFRLVEGDGKGIGVRRIKRQWQAAFNDSKRPVLMEKSPPNVARIRWLNDNFENSHFVAIVRDPYATVEGLMRKGGLDLIQAAHQWEVSNRIMLSDLEHVPRTLLITYEQLTADTSAVLDGVSAFVGLTPLLDGWAVQSIRIHERRDAVVNLNSVSWKRLSAHQFQEVTNITLPIQEKLGYPRRERADA